MVCLNMAMEMLCFLKMYSLWKFWWFFIAIWVYRSKPVTVSSSPSILSPCVNLSTNTTVDPHLQRHTTGPRKKQRESKTRVIPHSHHFQQENWKAVEVDVCWPRSSSEYIITHYFQCLMCFLWHRPNVYLPSRLAWWLEIFFKLIPFT